MQGILLFWWEFSYFDKNRCKERMDLIHKCNSFIWRKVPQQRAGHSSSINKSCVCFRTQYVTKHITCRCTCHIYIMIIIHRNVVERTIMVLSRVWLIIEQLGRQQHPWMRATKCTYSPKELDTSMSASASQKPRGVSPQHALTASIRVISKLCECLRWALFWQTSQSWFYAWINRSSAKQFYYCYCHPFSVGDMGWWTSTFTSGYPCPASK